MDSLAVGRDHTAKVLSPLNYHTYDMARHLVTIY